MPRLDILDCTAQGTREISVEEWPVETIHDGYSQFIVPAEDLLKTVAALGQVSRLDLVITCLQITRLLPLDLLALTVICVLSGTVASSQLGHAEDRFPACLVSRVSVRCRITESRRCKSTLGPAVVDCGEVPLDFVWRGVAIEFVANVNKDLNRSDINVVDRRGIYDHSFEGWTSIMGLHLLSTAWPRIIPRAVLKCTSDNGRGCKEGWRR
jgi:hypothetical protein